MVINELRMNPNYDSIAHVLNRSGYDTMYIGKWHLWSNQYGNHFSPENSYIPPGPYRLGFDGFWAAYNFHHYYYGVYYHTNSPEKIPVDGYEPDFQTNMATDVLKQAAQSSRPFALFLSYGTPHDPWRLRMFRENFSTCSRVSNSHYLPTTKRRTIPMPTATLT